MPISINKNGGRVVVRDTTNATYVIAGNNSVSNVALSNESVDMASITQVNWSGTWTVARGANTILSLAGNGDWNLAKNGIPLYEFPAATLVLTLTGSGSIIVELSKQSNTSAM